MFVLDNVPLQAYSTMRLGGVAAHLVEITDRFEIQQAVDWAKSQGVPCIAIGHGSNIIWQDSGYPGLIIVNKIKRFEVFEQDDTTVYVTIGAGENWDEAVKKTVEMGLSGIETLSLIPGTAGATPVQNVGAYGTEIADVLMTVEAFDTQSNSFVTLRGSDCDFSYRSSMFKTTHKHRYIISAITLQLHKTIMKPPFYRALQHYLESNNINDYSPASIREAVIAIRSEKLPDPQIVANNGSFFQNPIVDQGKINLLIGDFPDLAYWDLGNGTSKVSAAWLVEQAGFKDYQDDQTGMRTWPKQPLVFVNDHASSTNDLLQFKQKIVTAVKEKFNIELQQEPELIPSNE